jgi:hypothetical protein
MTTYERINEIKNNADLRIENAAEAYAQAELELVNLVGDYAVGAEVSCKAFGPGHINAYTGTTLEGLIVEIEFADITKKYSLMHIITVGNFVVLENTFELGTIWSEAMTVHNDLTKQLRELQQHARLLEAEAVKKAAAAKKAEEQFQRSKAKAIKDFEELTTKVCPKSTADEFYYSLGWLVNNTTSFSAALPDYLLSSFEKQFGTEANPTVVDSKKRTVNGFPMQWALSMKASIKKAALELIPTYLTKYLGKAGNAITDTSFVWDLVDNYGFQFGKKQDVGKIRENIPSCYLEFFEAGLAA